MYSCCEFHCAPTWLVLLASPSIALFISPAKAFSVVIEMDCSPATKHKHIQSTSNLFLIQKKKNNVGMFTAPESPICLWTHDGFGSLDFLSYAAYEIFIWPEKNVWKTNNTSFPLQLKATLCFFFNDSVMLWKFSILPTCIFIALWTEGGGWKGGWGQLSSQPPTGALCMKSIGSRTLSSLTQA